MIPDGVLVEIDGTPGPRKGQLLDVVATLHSHFESSQRPCLHDDDLQAQSKRARCASHRLNEESIAFLPGAWDRRLIIESLFLRSHVFLTTDYKTIWRYQTRLASLGINVKMPLEYLKTFLFPLEPANLGYCGPDDFLNLLQVVDV